MQRTILLVSLLLICTFKVFAQTNDENTEAKKYFVGSSLLVLANFIPNDPSPPDFVQLNLGYRLTPKDIVSIEAITWKYSLSLAIPFGESFEADEEKFPGYVREF